MWRCSDWRIGNATRARADRGRRPRLGLGRQRSGPRKCREGGASLVDLFREDWSRFAPWYWPRACLSRTPNRIGRFERLKALASKSSGHRAFLPERASLLPCGTLHRHHRHQWQIHYDSADRTHFEGSGPRCAARRQYRPCYPYARTAGTRRVYVVECSSFQIDLAPSIRPSVGVLLNVTPDHLDRHGTMENYAGVKERLIAGADKATVVIDDRWTGAVAEKYLRPVRTFSPLPRSAKPTSRFQAPRCSSARSRLPIWPASPPCAAATMARTPVPPMALSILPACAIARSSRTC